MPILRISYDPCADREGPLRSTVKGFHMVNDIGLYKICPVGHIMCVAGSRTAYIDCKGD